MADYPDYTRLFWLFGSTITIPINIEASDVTLPVSIDAVTAELEVTIVASDVNLNINLASSAITLNVNLQSQTANINFTFADQSVAVFDASKWFAHEAAQVFIHGQGTIGQDACSVICSRTVPTGKIMFVTGMGWGLDDIRTPPTQMMAMLRLDATITAGLGAVVGDGLTFDTPLRAVAGEVVDLYVCQYGAGGNRAVRATFWGYDEEA